MANKYPTSIKTINQKIRRLGRKYGTESLEYKKYLSDIDRNFEYHYTKDGILQIKKPAKLSKYQQQIIKKLQGRKGIKALEADAKKRLIAEGAKKPTKQEIEQEVRKFTERQTAIDDLLDSIYLEEAESSLPTDIADIYSRIHRHGKGAGSGVTNKDIDNLIAKMELWKRLKQELTDLSREIERRNRMTNYYSDKIWRATTGRESLQTIETQILPELREYIKKLDE
jgi:hypothetical protein